MSSTDIKDLRAEVKALKNALDKLGKVGIERQTKQTIQLNELKNVIVEAHEKEKKKLLDDIALNSTLHKMVNETNVELLKTISAKDKEIAELKKGKA